MTPRRTSLLRTLFMWLLVPGVLAAIVGVFIVYTLVKEEYDELQDLGLTSKAHLLLTVFEAAPDRLNVGNALAFEKAALQPDEMTIFWIVDRHGQIIVASKDADPLLLPGNEGAGLRTAKGHRFVTVRSDRDANLSVIVATPMNERNEAIRDVLAGVILGFVVLGLLAAAAAYWTVQRSAGVIAALSRNIAEKGAQNLSPIDRANSFTEIEPAIDTLDTLMARLDAALAAERAFATNAAHELRTPLAICLAQVQRLKARLTDAAMSENAVEIEQGLKRLVRLIERLLQMSRAQSGLGITSKEADVSPVISLLLKEMRDREPSPDRLVIHMPVGSWPSHVDPDALGIILGNIIENALKYRDGDAPTVVDARQLGRVSVSNDCAPLTPADLETIQRRFVRKATLSDGFGLGLSIVQELCIQSGCGFEVVSPQVGTKRGFTAILTLPKGNIPA
jgi:two-component system OmpR family sensor kinase